MSRQISPVPTRCCTCFGRYGNEELEDRMFVEQRGGLEGATDFDEPEYIRGWMCRECAIIHWAWLVREMAGGTGIEPVSTGSKPAGSP